MMDRDLCYLLNKQIEWVAERFVEKYFETTANFYFVEEHMFDELNYTLYVNDYYFSMQDVYYALRYDIPRDVIDEWYDKSLEQWMIDWWYKKGKKWVTVPNLKNYFLMNNVEKS